MRGGNSFSILCFEEDKCQTMTCNPRSWGVRDRMVWEVLPAPLRSINYLPPLHLDVLGHCLQQIQGPAAPLRHWQSRIIPSKPHTFSDPILSQHCHEGGNGKRVQGGKNWDPFSWVCSLFFQLVSQSCFCIPPVQLGPNSENQDLFSKFTHSKSSFAISSQCEPGSFSGTCTTQNAAR